MGQPELDRTPPTVDARLALKPDQQDRRNQAHVDHHPNAVLTAAEQMVITQMLFEELEVDLDVPTTSIQLHELLKAKLHFLVRLS